MELRLVSGAYKGKKGPAKSEYFTAMLRMKKGSSYAVTLPVSNSVAFYVLEGQLRINEERFAS